MESVLWDILTRNMSVSVHPATQEITARKVIKGSNIIDRAPVAQSVEHWTITREVVSSTPAGPTLRVFK